MKYIILLVIIFINIMHAESNYECAIMQIQENDQIIYDAQSKKQPAPFAKTLIRKKDNVIFDGTFYYQYYKSKNNTDFYINKPMKMMIGMSSNYVKIINNSKIYSLFIANKKGNTNMTFVCQEK